MVGSFSTTAPVSDSESEDIRIAGFAATARLAFQAASKEGTVEKTRVSTSVSGLQNPQFASTLPSDDS